MSENAAAFARPSRVAAITPPPARPTTARSAQPAPTPTMATPKPSPHERVLIMVTTHLRDRLKAVATSKNTTYRDLVFDAIESTVDKLPELMTHRTGQETNTGLFNRSTTRPNTSAEGKVQVTIRGITAQNRAVLNDLVQSTGAPSLTALITAALEAHLPERPRSLRN